MGHKDFIFMFTLPFGISVTYNNKFKQYKLTNLPYILRYLTQNNDSLNMLKKFLYFCVPGKNSFGSMAHFHLCLLSYVK